VKRSACAFEMPLYEIARSEGGADMRSEQLMPLILDMAQETVPENATIVEKQNRLSTENKGRVPFCFSFCSLQCAKIEEAVGYKVNQVSEREGS